MDDESNLEEESNRCKIVETVLDILKKSDIETATEVSIRAAASERLGVDLNELTHRRLVRHLVDSFLLSTATTTASIQQNQNNNNNNNEKNDEIAVDNQKNNQQRFSDKVICKLSDRRRVTIHDFNGRTMVSIRDFYMKDGNAYPRKDANSGLSMASEQWSSFRNSFPLIEEAIAKLESRLSAKQSEAEMRTSLADSAAETSQVKAFNSDLTTTFHDPFKRKQTEADTSRSVIASNTQEHTVADREGNGAGISGLITSANSPGEVSAERRHAEADIPTSRQTQYRVNVSHAQRLIPLQPARFDGRNYHSWQHYMELFLKQLNLAYVLVKPCPRASLNPKASFDENVGAQAAIQRWVDDDYMCRDNILKTLSDRLFQRYSEKNHSARDLWEELKSLYDEDFGTRSSQINKYINFQMVDGVSVLEQVQELHLIVDSIIAQGVWVDENFHVSAIVSKLPPSWKDLRIRLMQKEFLPLSLLTHRLQEEEEYRSFHKKETNYKRGHRPESKFDHRLGTRKNENKRVCYSCGKEGHSINHCRYRKSEFLEKRNEKENGVLASHTDQYGGSEREVN